MFYQEQCFDRAASLIFLHAMIVGSLPVDWRMSKWRSENDRTGGLVIVGFNGVLETFQSMGGRISWIFLPLGSSGDTAHIPYVKRV